MSCGVGCRHGSDPVMLWLWGRPTAIAPIQPLTWNLHVVGAAPPTKRHTSLSILIKTENSFKIG